MNSPDGRIFDLHAPQAIKPQDALLITNIESAKPAALEAKTVPLKPSGKKSTSI